MAQYVLSLGSLKLVGNFNSFTVNTIYLHRFVLRDPDLI